MMVMCVFVKVLQRYAYKNNEKHGHKNKKQKQKGSAEIINQYGIEKKKHINKKKINFDIKKFFLLKKI